MARRIPVAKAVRPIFVFVRFATIGIWTILSSRPVISFTRYPLTMLFITIFPKKIKGKTLLKGFEKDKIL